MRILFIWLAVISGSGILMWLVWVVLGRAIATSLDRHFLSGLTVQSITPLAINQHDFVIGSRGWPLPRRGRFNLKITADEKNRLLFSVGNNALILGTISKIWAEPGEPQYQFEPDAGDTISFTRSTSGFVWPTSPFRFNIMGIKMPTWRRNAYDRFLLKKVSGATVEIIWRDEQNFYAGTGWTDTNTNQLAAVTVRPSPYENAVIKYLAGAKGWLRRDYHLEWSAQETNLVVVTVSVVADESLQSPGGGKSILLQIDPATGRIVKELAFQ